MGMPSRLSSARRTRYLLCFVLVVLHVPVIFGELDTRDASAKIGLTSDYPPQSESGSVECAFLRIVPAYPGIDRGFYLPIPPSWPESEPIQPRPDSEGPCHPLDAYKPIIVDPPSNELPDGTLPSGSGVSISVR
jgi:hypothetical protein